MQLEKVFKTINKVAKHEKTPVYAVGGFVRDTLLGIEDKKDLDFVVIGSGLEFAKKLDAEMKQVGSLVEFPDFDTARYIIKFEVGSPKSEVQIELEFAGARSEKYDKKSRKPKVTATTLEEDLKRRDFTVNTMAIDVKKLSSRIPKGEGSLFKALKLGINTPINNTQKRDFSPDANRDRNDNFDSIIDPLGGQIDLAKKLLRTPLDPDETFSEDPLRMMRAARFASQLGFAIEAKTYEAMCKNKDRLKIISAERIQEELFKILVTEKPSIGLRILFDSGLMEKFLPEACALSGVEEIFGNNHKDNFEHTMKVIDNVAEHSDKVLLRYAALMHDIGKPGTKKYARGRGWTFDMHEHLGRKIVRQVGKRLRLSTSDIDYVAKLVRWHQQPIQLMDEKITDSAIRRLFVNLGEDFEDLLILCKSDITTGNPTKKVRRLKNYDYLEKRVEEIIEKDKMRAFQSPFRGDEIMTECGLKPGPTVGKIKKALEEAILDGKIPNEYEATKKYFFEIKDKYLLEVENWERK